MYGIHAIQIIGRRRVLVPVPSTRLAQHTWTLRVSASYHLSCLEHFIAQQQVGGDACSRGYAVAQHAERVVDAFLVGIHGFSRREIQAYNVSFGMLVLQCGHYRLVSTDC